MLDKDGYVLLKLPTHPFASRHGYVREHRLVVEKDLGRYLTTDEVIHHKNGAKNDNRISNLELMTKSEHMSHHGSIERWSKMHNCCVFCKTTKVKHNGNGFCWNCYKRNERGTL